MTDAKVAAVRRAIAGEKAAERALLKEILPAVQKGVASVLRKAPRREARDTRQEVAELCQQVLLELFEDHGKKIAMWDPDRGLSLPRYIELVARHIVIGILRTRHKNPWEMHLVEPSDIDALMGECESPEQIVAREELKVTTLASVESQLTDKGRAVLNGFLAGQSIDEVAAHNQMSTNAVYVWRTRIAQLAARALSASTPFNDLPPTPTPSFNSERLSREVS